jgi:hypothetical protein
VVSPPLQIAYVLLADTTGVLKQRSRLFVLLSFFSINKKVIKKEVKLLAQIQQ